MTETHKQELPRELCLRGESLRDRFKVLGLRLLLFSVLGIAIAVGTFLSFRGSRNEYISAAQWIGFSVGLTLAAACLVFAAVIAMPRPVGVLDEHGIRIKHRGQLIRISWESVEQLSLHRPAGAVNSTLLAAWLRPTSNLDQLPHPVRAGRAPLWLGHLERSRREREAAAAVLAHWAGSRFQPLT